MNLALTPNKPTLAPFMGALTPFKLVLPAFMVYSLLPSSSSSFADANADADISFRSGAGVSD
eukprot:3941273-Rhodomonas_salina.8